MRHLDRQNLTNNLSHPFSRDMGMENMGDSPLGSCNQKKVGFEKI